MTDVQAVLTIGHSTHPIETFLDLLARHGVTAVADVRSSPFSRFNSQYNRENLARSLKEVDIAYVFLGDALGARANDPSCYIDGRVQYGRLAMRPAFREGIARLKKGAAEHRIALMCAEKEPLDCHRTLLVARALDVEGVPVAHILADGALESHATTMDRLIDVAGLSRDDLFRSRDEIAAEALRLQEQKIAYVDAEMAAGREDPSP
jgi:uncharacterized protein (DUF488 family)